MIWFELVPGEWRLLEGDEVVGVAWYGSACWQWRVYVDGARYREGDGCIDKAEAQREVMALLERIAVSGVDKKHAAALSREEMRKRLEAIK